MPTRQMRPVLDPFDLNVNVHHDHIRYPHPHCYQALQHVPFVEPAPTCQQKHVDFLIRVQVTL